MLPPQAPPRVHRSCGPGQKHTVALIVALSSLVFVLVGTAVGLRIVHRARAERSLPEIAVGVALVAFSGVTHPIGLARAALQPHAGLSGQIALQLVSTVGSCVTVVGVYLFTWGVFRRGWG